MDILHGTLSGPACKSRSLAEEQHCSIGCLENQALQEQSSNIQSADLQLFQCYTCLSRCSPMDLCMGKIAALLEMSLLDRPSEGSSVVFGACA